MKANTIRLLDYETQDGLLALVLAETTLEAITGMDTALVSIQTDDGDTVETFAGFALRSVTFDLDSQTYKATLVPSTDDKTAEALAALAGKLEALAKIVEEMEPLEPPAAGLEAITRISGIMLAQGAMAGTVTADQVLACSELVADWTAGKYAVGDVRNHGGQTWKCCQAHDNTNNPDIEPGKTAGAAFWAPYHATNPAQARPFVKPTGAHDIYKKGEVMVWTNGKSYRCKQDTDHSPTSNASAWEVVK